MSARRAWCLLLCIACWGTANASTTLDRIRQTGILRCGINHETAEFSTSDDHGERAAFDSDLCKAVAVAILGSNARTAEIGYPDDVTSMEGLRTGQVDLLPTLTLDLTHSTAGGLAFTGVVLYDGVGFLVPIKANIAGAMDLTGKKVCFLAETEVEVALQGWFARRHLKFLPFPFQEEGEMEAAFVTGNCAALAGDLTRLASTRLGFGLLAPRYVLLPETISKDPLAAAVRADDPAFEQIVRWTMEVLVAAEESGLTQAGASTAAGTDPTVVRLRGDSHEIGGRLGLPNDWAIRVVEAVGNYGQIFERDLGTGSDLKLPRGLNRQGTDGGLLYALPLK